MMKFKASVATVRLFLFQRNCIHQVVLPKVDHSRFAGCTPPSIRLILRCLHGRNTGIVNPNRYQAIYFLQCCTMTTMVSTLQRTQIFAKNSSASWTSINSKEMLKSNPNGAYTTGRTIDDGCSVFQLDYHINRLIKSAR